MIELKNVSFQYKDCEEKNILENLNLKINRGEVILLCGESGCGKTTITRLLNGLIPQFYEGALQGKVLIENEEISSKPVSKIAESVGSVFQNPRTQFFNVDTTSELIFGCENLGWDKETIIKQKENIINQFNIETLMDRSIFALSGGEKQKIACASVSAMNPNIIVLDEPSSSLDFQSINDLRKVIQLWKEQGKTIVIAEHRIFYLNGLLDRVIYMKRGQIQKEMSAKNFELLSHDELLSLGLRCYDLKQVRFNSNGNEKSSAITIKDMIFQYKKTSLPALAVDDLILPSTGVIAVIGHNGAGKSTFARCLCGLEKNCKGILEYHNQKMDRRERLKISYMVMQDVNHQLFTESVDEEIQISMEKDNEEKKNHTLNSLDLSLIKDAHPLAISGGQQQRVAIASAIASNSEIIIFDEPTSGLDLYHMKEVSHLLKILKDKEKLIFLITHDYELICECCTHILQLEKGIAKDNYSLDEKGFLKIQTFFGYPQSKGGL